MIWSVSRDVLGGMNVMDDMTYRDTPDLLTPAQVARRFHVDPKTVTRWAVSGKLPCIKTLGGHRRYLKSVVDEAFAHLQSGKVAK